MIFTWEYTGTEKENVNENVFLTWYYANHFLHNRMWHISLIQPEEICFLATKIQVDEIPVRVVYYQINSGLI